MIFISIRSLAIGLAVLGLWLSVLTPGRAELPPTAYEKFQQAAPEALIIQVQEVSRRQIVTADSKITYVQLQASVVKVRRTATRLKPGEKITITYEVTEHLKPWVGPSEVTVPDKATECPAYLKRDKTGAGDYHPAAGGYSFRKLL